MNTTSPPRARIFSTASRRFRNRTRHGLGFRPAAVERTPDQSRVIAQSYVRLEPGPHAVLTIRGCLRQFPHVEVGTPHPRPIWNIDALDERREAIRLVQECDVPREEKADLVSDALRRRFLAPEIHHAFVLRDVAEAVHEVEVRRDADDQQPVEFGFVRQAHEERPRIRTHQRELKRPAPGHFLPDVEIRVEKDPGRADDHDIVVMCVFELSSLDCPVPLAVVQVAGAQAERAHFPFPGRRRRNDQHEHQPFRSRRSAPPESAAPSFRPARDAPCPPLRTGSR